MCQERTGPSSGGGGTQCPKTTRFIRFIGRSVSSVPSFHSAQRFMRRGKMEKVEKCEKWLGISRRPENYIDTARTDVWGRQWPPHI
jgi:hypothetical protein